MSFELVLSEMSSPFRELQKAGLLPRQIAKMVADGLYQEADGFTGTPKLMGSQDPLGYYENVAGPLYDRRDAVIPTNISDKLADEGVPGIFTPIANARGLRSYNPSAERMAARQTEGSDAQKAAVKKFLAPFLLTVHEAFAAKRIGKQDMERISMLFASMGNESTIGGLKWEDGKDYFIQMEQYIRNWYGQAGESPAKLETARTRIKFKKMGPGPDENPPSGGVPGR